jgi:hypothetical protein
MRRVSLVFLEASVLLSVKHINIMAALLPLAMSSSKGKLITYLAMDADTYDLMAVSYLPRNQKYVTTPVLHAAPLMLR